MMTYKFYSNYGDFWKPALWSTYPDFLRVLQKIYIKLKDGTGFAAANMILKLFFKSPLEPKLACFLHTIFLTKFNGNYQKTLDKRALRMI
jgi:hypothetical protein